MTLYALRQPDGTLLDMPPTTSREAAFAQGAKIMMRQRNGQSLRVGTDLGAACYRASDGDMTPTPSLATTIGLLMGYQAVEVEIRERGT